LRIEPEASAVTSLIRGHETHSQHGIRALTSGERKEDRAATTSQSAPPPTRSRNPEIAALEGTLADLQRTMEENRRAFAKALEAARVEGRKEAEQAYTSVDAKALAALEASIDTANKDLHDQLAGMESLSLLMAQTALEKVFAGSSDYQDLMARAIRRQMEQLRAESVIRVVVSAADFPNDASVGRLAQAIASGRIEILRDEQLPRGECRMDLRLGHAELSIAKHWEALQGVFRKLADGARP
jgi:flagellar biosynthesis/type III secretory pathway protein FliH